MSRDAFPARFVIITTRYLPESSDEVNLKRTAFFGRSHVHDVHEHPCLLGNISKFRVAPPVLWAKSDADLEYTDVQRFRPSCNAPHAPSQHRNTGTNSTTSHVAISPHCFPDDGVLHWQGPFRRRQRHLLLHQLVRQLTHEVIRGLADRLHQLNTGTPPR